MSRRRIEYLISKPPLAVGNLGKRDHLSYIVTVIEKMRKHQEVSLGELEELEYFCDDMKERINVERRKLNGKKQV